MALEHHVLTSACGEYTRDVWLMAGPEDVANTLCVFLDGEFYLGGVNAPLVIHDLMASGVLPAMTCVFVSNVNGEARHHDYTCNPRYARFIVEDVVNWARERANLLENDHTICGLSLSGLESAAIALWYPEVFSRALCQSGSFWWLEGREIDFPSSAARLWMGVGEKEVAFGITHPPSGLYQGISQIEGVDKAARLFQGLGATVRYSMHKGGHASKTWVEELPGALAWLFGRDMSAD